MYTSKDLVWSLTLAVDAAEAAGEWRADKAQMTVRAIWECFALEEGEAKKVDLLIKTAQDPDGYGRLQQATARQLSDRLDQRYQRARKYLHELIEEGYFECPFDREDLYWWVTHKLRREQTTAKIA